MTRPDGGTGVYGVTEVRQPAVFVVPVTDDGEVLLVELFRYTTGVTSLEVPAGGSDGEDLLVAARRELAEEAGVEAREWTRLGSVYSLNGVADAPGEVFLARGLTAVSSGSAQLEEGITAVRRVPWADLWDLVRAGGVTDGETLSALLLARVHLGL